jgi:hypothetical protein
MRILPRRYFWYKFVNSVFNGLTVGAIFTMYAPLEPSVFSVGGILLAVGMIVVARYYDYLIRLERFYRISLFVEWVMLFAVLLYLVHPYGYMTALLIYAGYQLVFTFGSYLVRAETLFLPRRRLLSWLDIYKQSGYLAGLALAWGLYRLFEQAWGITENAEKVYAMHWGLLVCEGVIIWSLVRSFSKAERT